MFRAKQTWALMAAIGLLTACSDSPDTSTITNTNTPAPPADQLSTDATALADDGVQTSETAAPGSTPDTDRNGHHISVTEVAQFASPWAMTFLPDGRLLVSEMAGTLRLHDPADNTTGTIAGVPEVEQVAQGGLGDVVLHPQFDSNQWVYISYVESDDDGLGAVVARARLTLDDAGGGTLEDLETLWRQTPKKSGGGHFAYRILFDNDGMLWISSGERTEFDPAQEMDTNLGKIVRLNDDGSVPDDNPFTDDGDVAAQVWSLGHRNILGMDFDAEGRLWAHEMGPAGGDELNLIEKGANYGYPLVSNGNHYGGTEFPDHDTRPEFTAPVITWTPVISPAGFVIYDGNLFPQWQGSGFIGGLSSRSLVRVEFDGETAREAERFDMQRRIREVEQGPDGALWLLEDGTRQGDSWLLRLTPADQQ